MMSHLVFVAWSRPVLSLCCTEYGPSCDAVLSDHFTTVVMSRSGQLGSRVFKAHSCVTEALQYVPIVQRWQHAGGRRTHGSTGAPLSARQSPEP
jgi:hypothetical protein